jgi:hypothetical protein
MALVVAASVVEDKIGGGEGLVGAATHGSGRRRRSMNVGKRTSRMHLLKLKTTLSGKAKAQVRNRNLSELLTLGKVKLCLLKLKMVVLLVIRSNHVRSVVCIIMPLRTVVESYVKSVDLITRL